MAIVINPFFSLSASGTAGGVTAARSGTGYTAKAKNKSPTAPPSAAQLTCRATMRAAAAAWHTLDQATADKWRALTLPVCLTTQALFDTTTGNFTAATKINLKHGYASFVREYVLQGVTPPALPRIPSQSYGQVHP